MPGPGQPGGPAAPAGLAGPADAAGRGRRPECWIPQPRSEQGLTALRAAAADCLSPAGQLQVATALDRTGMPDTRLAALRHQRLDAARHLTGAKVLAARRHGAGPVTALAVTCWLGGAAR
jgi:hypothetical protein